MHVCFYRIGKDISCEFVVKYSVDNIFNYRFWQNQYYCHLQKVNITLQFIEKGYKIYDFSILFMHVKLAGIFKDICFE